MIKRRWLLDKKAENLMFPIVIFLVLNILFFSILLIFVSKSSTGALIYEQAYAKEIGLMIDNAKPDTKIILDFKKGIEIAEENNQGKEGLISINGNQVVVKLSGVSGYSFSYYSDYDVSSEFNENNLILTIKDKENEK